MQRQAALQAGRLARATLVAAASWGPGSRAAPMDLFNAAKYAATISPAATGSLAAAAAAAAICWPRSLQAWAAKQQQQGGDIAAAGQHYNWQRHEQQRGMASAQAEPSTSGSSEAAGAAAKGLAISDAAVQRLKELQAQVRCKTNPPARACNVAQ